jgi:hypothetical protein
LLPHLTPRLAAEDGEPGMLVAVRVRAVVAGALVHVAAWDPESLHLWPEIARGAVVVAMRVLTELQEHGADTGARQQVDVLAAAEQVTAGFPALPAQVNAGG